jgi:hypothetical protein
MGTEQATFEIFSKMLARHRHLLGKLQQSRPSMALLLDCGFEHPASSGMHACDGVRRPIGTLQAHKTR